MSYWRTVAFFVAMQVASGLYIFAHPYLAGRFNFTGFAASLHAVAMLAWFIAVLALLGMLISEVVRRKCSLGVALSIMAIATVILPAIFCAIPWRLPGFDRGFIQWADTNIDVAAIQKWRQTSFPDVVADQPTPFWWRMEQGVEAPLGTRAEPAIWPAEIVRLNPDEVRAITFDGGTLIAWRGTLASDPRMVFVANRAASPPTELHQNLISWCVVNDRLSVGIFDPH